jgi:hypothetical protein
MRGRTLVEEGGGGWGRSNDGGGREGKAEEGTEAIGGGVGKAKGVTGDGCREVDGPRGER